MGSDARPPKSSARPAPHVLVVDDQESVLASMVAVLELRGYSVHGATSAEAALDYVRDHAPQILLVDVHLGRTDGIELAKLITSKVPGVRVVVMTGDPIAEGVLERARHAGIPVVVLNKPAHPDQLFSALEAAS